MVVRISQIKSIPHSLPTVFWTW